MLITTSLVFNDTPDLTDAKKMIKQRLALNYGNTDKTKMIRTDRVFFFFV